MELVSEVAPYYVRKKPIEILLKLLNDATSVACYVLDNDGTDITNKPGVLYSKMNILNARKSINSDICKLCLFFQRARYRVTLKFVAIGVNEKIVASTCCSFRVYSEKPRVKRKTHPLVSDPTIRNVVMNETGNSKRPRVDDEDFWFSEQNANISISDGDGGTSPNDNNNHDKIMSDSIFNFDLLVGSDSPFEYNRDYAPEYERSKEGAMKEKFYGVPRFPFPLLTFLHEKEINYAVKSLILMNNEQRNKKNIHGGIGITGMTGIGKTVVLSRIARDPRICKNFTGGIYWMSIASLNTNMYQLLVELGGKSGIDVQNPSKSCNRAVEKLILQSGDSTLIIVDNVRSKKQIHAIQTEVNRSRNSTLIIGTSRCGILPQSGIENISLAIPSQKDSIAFISTIASAINGNMNNTDKYNPTTTTNGDLIDNKCDAIIIEPTAEEKSHVNAVSSLVGRLPLAMNIAARCKTFVFGYEEILGTFKLPTIFAEGGYLEMFSIEMHRKIRMLEKDPYKIALLTLAAGMNEEIKYEEPFYMIPTHLLARFWGVSETKMRICFQALLEAGLVSFKETCIREVTGGFIRQTKESYLMLHVLTARYLAIVSKHFSRKNFHNDLDSQNFSGSHNLLCLEDGENNTGDGSVTNALYLNDEIRFMTMLNQSFNLIDLYLYLDTVTMQKFYNLILDTALHDSPFKEFYNRRNEVPEEVAALFPIINFNNLCHDNSSITTTDNYVTGVDKAIQFIKDKIEAEKSALIGTGKKEGTKKWTYNMEVLNRLGKSFENLIEAMLDRMLEASESQKPKDLREYNVAKTMVWLEIWFDYGNTIDKMCTLEECLWFDSTLGCSRAVNKNGTRVVSVLSRLVDTSFVKDGKVTMDIFTQACWAEAHLMLFDLYESKTGVDVYWDCHDLTRHLETLNAIGAGTVEIIRMEKLMVGVYCSPKITVYLYAPDKKESFFSDGFAVQMSTVFSDVNMKVIRSEKEFDAACNVSGSSVSSASNYKYWKRICST
jgi:hypothetical protein